MRYQDEVKGSLISQADKVVDLLFMKYLKADISYEGVTRVETYPYPKEALKPCTRMEVLMKSNSDEKKRKTLSGGIVLILICAMFTQMAGPFFSNAKKKAEVSGSCGENAVWQYDETTKTMTVSGTGAVTVGGWKDEDWFKDSYDYSGGSENLVETLVIEDGITAIGKGAFDSGCMTEVRLPETLTEIGASAFSECVNIKTLNIPETVTKIGREAFYSCWSLEKLRIPEGVTRLGPSVVDGCIRLASLELPRTLKSDVNKLGIRHCAGLREIVNHTKQDIKVPDFKKRVSWKVNKRLVQTVKAGKTGKAIPKKYKITYRANGGKIKGKKKTSYCYGDIVYIDAVVEKKNAYFIGWDAVGNKNEMFFEGGFNPEDDEPAQGNVTLEAKFLYYNKKQTGKNVVTLSFDVGESDLLYQDIVVRYYTDQSKRSESKINYMLMNSKKKSMKIKKLKKGKTYYFEFTTVDPDSSWDEDLDYIQKTPEYWNPIGSLKLK